MKPRSNVTNRQEEKQQRPTAESPEVGGQKSEVSPASGPETGAPVAPVETVSSSSSGTATEEGETRRQGEGETAEASPVAMEVAATETTATATNKAEVPAVRSIVLPSMEELRARGFSDALATSVLLAEVAAGAALAYNPAITDPELNVIRQRIINVEVWAVIEGDRRAIFPVPTIQEVIVLGYDAKFAPDIVLGALSRYAMRVSVPSVGAVMALGFDQDRAGKIVEDLVAEKRFEEIWGAADSELIDRLRAMAEDKGTGRQGDRVTVPIAMEMGQCVLDSTDKSDGLKVLGLMGRMMDMVLNFTGHAEGPEVRAWRGELAALKDELDLRRGDW